MPERRDAMKKMLMFLGLVGVLLGGFKTIVADETDWDSTIVAVDVYDFKLSLKVPQVFNNTKSTGYRSFKYQRIVGTMYVQWLEGGGCSFAFSDLKNRDFRVGGAYVTYDGVTNNEMLYGRLNWIGNNKTEVFKIPTLCMGVEFRPSYATGEGTEDNSFVLVLSGKGSSGMKRSLGAQVATTFWGYASGTQGCGCAAYSHKSPTRRGGECGPTSAVDDVVATFGIWRARWKGRAYCR